MGLAAGIALTLYLTTWKNKMARENKFLEQLRQLSPDDQQKEHYFDLWKYYSKHADEVKEKLWATVTWLVAIEGALLAFLVNVSLIS